MKKICQRQGCDNVITDVRLRHHRKLDQSELRKVRKDRIYCSVYCNQRSWDLKNRTPKKFQMEEINV